MSRDAEHDTPPAQGVAHVGDPPVDDSTPVRPAGDNDRPTAPQDEGSRSSHRAKKIIAVLSVTTATLSMLTAALGFVSYRFNEQKNDAASQVIALSTEVTVLTEQVTTLGTREDQLMAEAAELRRERDTIEQQLESLAEQFSTAPPSDPLAADATYLSDEQTLNRSNWRDGTARVGGEIYLHSAFGRQGSCSGEAKQAFAEYDLGRDYSRFTATLGLSDTNRRASHRVLFEVIVDGTQIHEVELTAGEAEPVDLDINGGLRLRLQVTFFADGACSGFDGDDRAVFGDAVLVPTDRGL